MGRGRAPGTCRRPWSKSRPAGFNPLGGGAGSGWSIWQALLNAFLLSFNRLARRWGGGRASSRPMTFGQCEKIGGVEFQSPRRWGGVGLETLEISMDTKAKVQYKFQSPRRWAGSGSEDLWARQRGHCCGFVSIPSEVGRGRAPRSPQRLARHELGERFSVSSRKRYKTRLTFFGTRVSWKTQETREQGGAGRNRGPKLGRSRMTFPTKVPSDSLGGIGSLKRTSESPVSNGFR